jgi:hypothetical protein
MGCKIMGSGRECQLLSLGWQTKHLNMLVTVLPNVKNEHIVTLDFQLWKRCNVWKRFLIGRSDLIVAMIAFLKGMHKIKQSICIISKNISNSILLYNFAENLTPP